ncbi:GH1 family beta-glucosidase [Pseudactinotalea sp. Z1748]|uniref:GH1 family beta-glucosidase n=1 Tax=Pseudactinotalea sp. Z1748 TaxID=3413027 RepID=UPI003C7BE808
MTTTQSEPTTTALAARFPRDFAFGAATASYQIEGAAREDGRGASIWDTFAQVPGKVLGQQNGEVAVDHYHRFAEDVAIMADLGLTSYRFSIAWPRIIPEGTGAVEQRGLDFYRRLLQTVREAGIEPVATLYHWDLPQSLQDRGGWANRDTVAAFSRYAEVVHGELGDLVDTWMTINEPWCAAFLGYGYGVHAPGLTDPRAALRAAHHLLLAHGRAVQTMRAQDQDHRYGIVPNLYGVVTGDSGDPEADRRAADTADVLQNRLWLDATLLGTYPEEVVALQERFGAADAVQHGDLEVIAQPLDVLGVNYYSQHHVIGTEPVPATEPGQAGQEHVEQLPPPHPRTAMGWSIEPHGLRDLLIRLKRDWPVPPIMITENGAAFDDELIGGAVHDHDRRDYLSSHIEAVAEAVEAGVDVRGYFAWSLLDNYEWAFGYDKRFGIVHVDYATQARTIKDSGHWYRDLTTAHRAHHAGT